MAPPQSLEAKTAAAPLPCRTGCGACCIAPSISTPIPSPDGLGHCPKPAGLPCPQLDDALLCKLFGQTTRPAVCLSLQPDATMCGANREQALRYLTQLECLTTPAAMAGTGQV